MIGSDLKSMVQCSQGWKMVGADVDSQEQWLAALFGDSISKEKQAGATPMSHMLLSGQKNFLIIFLGEKSEGTDLHSIVAKQVNIDRNDAKILNYARLYGAGKMHAMEFLKQKGLSEENAEKIAKKLFQTTKGTIQKYF